jgi:signal transduction histidine kinase/DNA-binding response OmpR family regulator
MSEPPADIADGSGAGARHVMLVDDDPDLADSLAGLLRLEGYRVAVAHSRDEALASQATEPAQVALVDIRLGRDNGVDLVRELRDRHPELVAVMMTAYASLDATVAALRAGAYDYLSKPFLSEQLLATLDRCFERSDLLAMRRQAQAALEARNRALEDLNARLTAVLSSVREISVSDSVDAIAESLLNAVMRDLEAAGGAVYWSESGGFRRGDSGAGYAGFIAPGAFPGLVAEAIATRMPVSGGASDGLAKVLDAGMAEAAIVAPLADGDGAAFALIIVHAVPGRRFDRRDLGVTHILTSFGTEVMHSARMHENLARSEELLRRIVEHSPSAIALSDLHGAHLLVNDRFAEWFVKSNAAEAWPDNLSDAAILRSGVAATREMTIASPNGAPQHLLVTRFPVVDGGRGPSGFGAIATDITDRRIADERWRQAQRMEAMGQLTGGIAHDFNNLLAVVLGNLRLIETKSGGSAELGELVADALDATRSGIDLVGRLLAFGRGQPLQPEATDIAQLVRRVARLLQRTLGEAISIRTDLAADPWSARIDRGQLEASVLNLAINARDAMPEGGDLTISVHNAILDANAVRDEPGAAPGRYVTLAVSDTGVGMSPEVQRTAAQPFFTTKSTGQGSGLGLSMVYGFVRQSGGHLRIDSAPGQGTTVTLFFPALAPRLPVARAIPPARAAQPAPGGSGGARILLVEDQPRVRQMLARMLRDLGYAPVEASDAAAALARLDEPPGVAILLTDIVLPGPMNGVQLGEAALARFPGLRVILTTGYAAEALSARAGPIASAPVLLKPVEPAVLARALQAASGAGTRDHQPPGDASM